MKRTYKLGTHNVKFRVASELPQGDNICGIAYWESKEVFTRITNANNGEVYELPSYLVVFFHEFFHMIDLMQGTGLFTDDDPDIDRIKEVKLDSFCEGFVQFMLDNKLLREKWVKDFTQMLQKVQPLEKEEE